jgi:hypothetical protein
MSGEVSNQFITDLMRFDQVLSNNGEKGYNKYL